jgi:hypothetical protein
VDFRRAPTAAVVEWRRSTTPEDIGLLRTSILDHNLAKCPVSIIHGEPVAETEQC